MIWLFRGANYPFMDYRRWAYVISGGLILATGVSIAARGGLEYSIDFTGGTLVQLDFEQPVEAQVLRSALEGMPGLESSEVQHFGDPSDVVVRAQVPQGEEEQFAQRIESHLREAPALEGHAFTVVRSEAVGPKIGQELKRDALMAILYAMGFILVYVAFRFDFKFGVAAILATAHDIVLSVGVFSLMGKEISLAVVAAFLTIVGYSLNDTIVVFDRIREDLKAMRREPFVEIVNRAVNETLSRTILTGGTTLVVLLFLFFIGGEVIHDFAFALIVGILIGTYSSIFVGAPLVVEWKHYIEDRRAASAPQKPSRKRKQPA
ncbi:MAG TPA: protein translocase subunit SecF [Gemmatimonadota bacterium]|nr:protein translocase subunit SecF [Gemmatimonadota bacterium]